MAAIGLKYFAYAPLTEDDTAGTYTYGTGKKGRKMVNANISLNIADSKFYADDTIAESVKEFIDGTISIGQDELTETMRTDMLGNTVTTVTVGAETDIKEVASKDTDVAPVLGIGFIQNKVVDKIRKYRAILLTKTQFGESNETAETKGNSINWQSPTIQGSIMRRNDGVWKEEVTVATLETAIAWINDKLNLT